VLIGETVLKHVRVFICIDMEVVFKAMMEHAQNPAYRQVLRESLLGLGRPPSTAINFTSLALYVAHLLGNTHPQRNHDAAYALLYEVYKLWKN
jgi:hypothetical protein